jgi:hypothetical protein
MTGRGKYILHFINEFGLLVVQDDSKVSVSYSYINKSCELPVQDNKKEKHSSLLLTEFVSHKSKSLKINLPAYKL